MGNDSTVENMKWSSVAGIVTAGWSAGSPVYMSEESTDCNVPLIFSMYLHGECEDSIYGYNCRFGKEECTCIM